MGRRLLVVVAFLGVSALSSPAGAQEQTGNAIRVFLDCGHFCDFDHFRRMVPYVDYVRDRRDAKVHVLVTRQRTGGGREFVFNFIGLEEFEGKLDTLKYVSSSTDTDDERRDGLVQTFTLGLMPFLVGTPIAARISVVYEAPSVDAEQVTATPETDPWNFWVFSARVGGFLQGESRTSNLNLNSSLRANRTTEEWKILIRANGFYSRSRFDLSDDSSLINITKNYSGRFELINSVTNHWSVGFMTSASKFTFLNRDIRLEFQPAVEYNFFPYDESTRRQLTFLYKLGVAYINYEETTIFGRDEETRPISSVGAGYSVRQQWGSAAVSVEASAFVNDLSKHRIDFFTQFRFRIVRGLDFNMYARFSRIKDQIHLSAAGISEAEILTRQKELGTDFRYFGNFSLSYTFGSIFNNVVNPRMEGF